MSGCSFTEEQLCRSCSCAAFVKLEQVQQLFFPIRTAKSHLKTPQSLFPQQKNPAFGRVSGHIFMLRFDISAKSVCTHHRVLVRILDPPLHHFQDAFVGMVRISPWVSGIQPPAAQPAGSLCSWTIFRVCIVPSVRAALGGFNYGLHSVFKHLDSWFFLPSCQLLMGIR